MQFGSASPRARPRAIDLNLIPSEYRRRPFPIITAGLALIIVGGIVLLYATFYLKTYGDMEIDHLQARVNQAREAIQTATGSSGAATAENLQRLLALSADFKALQERQVLWSQVFG